MEQETEDLNRQQIVIALHQHFTNLISPAAEREELLNIGPMARYIAEAKGNQEFMTTVIEDRVDELIAEEIKIYQFKQEKGHLEQFRESEKIKQEYWKSLVEDTAETFCKRHGCLNIIENQVFETYQKLGGAMDFTWRSKSQLVMAGYGKKELKPSVWTFDVGADLTTPKMKELGFDGGSFGSWTCYKIRTP